MNPRWIPPFVEPIDEDQLERDWADEDAQHLEPMTGDGLGPSDADPGL